MGVEPTMAASAAPNNGFEDRGAHRDSTTPALLIRSLVTLFLLQIIYHFGYLVKLLAFRFANRAK